MFKIARFISPFLLLALLAFVGREIFVWLQLLLPQLQLPVFAVIYLACLALTLLLFFRSRIGGSKQGHKLSLLGTYALGLVLNAVIFVCLGAVLKLLLRLFGTTLSAELLIWLGWLVVLLVFGFFIYGLLHARKIHLKRYDINIGGKKSSLKELKIALVSDLHLGHVVGEKQLSRIVDTINSTKADVVCIAGDVFDSSISKVSNIKAVEEKFAELRSTYGTYACLGNHDSGSGQQQIVDALAAGGIILLQDESRTIEESFVIYGKRDNFLVNQQGPLRTAEPELSAEEKRLPVIALDHQPSNLAEHFGQADLVLSGHTHAGQLFPMNIFSRLLFHHSYGFFPATEKEPQQIVTSGAGVWGPPLRSGSNCEVVEILLHFSPQQR